MLIPVIAAVLFIAVAAAAYAGRGKGLITSAPFPTVFFALGWLGAGALLGMLAGGLTDGERTPLRVIAVLALTAAGLALFAVGLVGIVRLPLRLTPPWYRGWVARGRRWDEFGGPEHLPRGQRWMHERTRRNVERHEARRRDRG